MRNFICILIATVLVFSLTGCSSSNNSKDIAPSVTYPDDIEETLTDSEIKVSILYAPYDDSKRDYHILWTFDDWTDDNGNIAIPYEMDFVNDYLLERYYIPIEAANKAPSSLLLQIVKDSLWGLLGPMGASYEPDTSVFHSHKCLSQSIAASVLFTRNDMAVTLYNDYMTDGIHYAVYEDSGYMCDRMTLNTYFEEAWLGSNLAYEQLDDNRRMNIINKACITAQYVVDNNTAGTPLPVPAFWDTIAEEQKQSGSLWYDYIMQNTTLETIKWLDMDWTKVSHNPYRTNTQKGD